MNVVVLMIAMLLSVAFWRHVLSVLAVIAVVLLALGLIVVLGAFHASSGVYPAALA